MVSLYANLKNEERASLVKVICVLRERRQQILFFFNWLLVLYIKKQRKSKNGTKNYFHMYF